ncbi:ATP-dependent DNA helicase PIF1 [Trifolium medium]|uniref:ATP-dependent DNA helicase PIF1 n=1 Tax=Trifolium medium TaxID=97028 RepID=A0A392MDG8_9FABA|nr:ATP-dependent DNA helicase PIF1 [Trifolium medium]
MKVRVMDHTDHAPFVIFDKDASSLFNMSCADMLEHTRRNGGVGSVPPQIARLVDKTWLFKVETKPSTNPRFEQTFRVRKICTDHAIITLFKDKWDKEEAAISKINNEVGSLSTLLEKGKDVLVCSSTNILSEDLQSLTGSSSKDKGKEIVCDSTHVALTQDLMNKFSSTVVNLDDDSVDTFDCIKNPKIQKSLISSKDLHESTASAVKGKAKEIDVEGTHVEETYELVGKRGTSVGNIGGDSVHSEKSVITLNQVSAIEENGSKNNKDLHALAEIRAKGNTKDMVLEGTPVGHIQQFETNSNSGLESASKVVIAPKQNASNEIKGAKSNKPAKRVSPQKEDEDDNAPIKLLKRAVKIEKIA